MPVVPLPGLDLNVVVHGSEDPSARPVVFVHGFLVDGHLWDAVAPRVAAAGMQAHVPDWPLGAHRIPAGPDADLTSAGVARLVLAYLDALDLHDVVLVGSDTGGAICQIALDLDATRIGSLVLTNCDAFENFPPRFFLPLFHAARHRRLVRALLTPMRIAALRHSPLAFGLLLRRPRPTQLTRSWVDPALSDARIRRDVATFARGLDRGALVELAPRLGRFTGPVRLVWGTLDRCFTLADARRLADAFDDAELIEVPDATTFVSIDRPDAVAQAIIDLHEGAGRAAPGGTSGQAVAGTA